MLPTFELSVYECLKMYGYMNTVKVSECSTHSEMRSAHLQKLRLWASRQDSRNFVMSKPYSHLP